MRFESYNLPVLASGTGAATSLDVRHHRTKAIQFSGVAAAGATLQIEGSLDGSHFVAIGSAVTTDALIELSTTAALLRVNRTVAGSGTITAVFGGLNARSD